jgi:hypothetical protein
MKSTLPDEVNIFLTVSPLAIDEHFNKNDPSPLYKRQLSQEFEQYIRLATASARRYTTIQYKVTCKTPADQQYTEPLIYAIKRHFSTIELAKQAEFGRFKKRNYVSLFIGLTIILLSHLLIPYFLVGSNGLETAILSGFDIFSWVMMWQPIDNLIFHWNSYLKEINTIKKITEAVILYTDEEIV